MNLIARNYQIEDEYFVNLQLVRKNMIARSAKIILGILLESGVPITQTRLMIGFLIRQQTRSKIILLWAGRRKVSFYENLLF